MSSAKPRVRPISESGCSRVAIKMLKSSGDMRDPCETPLVV